MGIGGIVMSLLIRRTGRDGLWDFLGKREACRNRVKLEEARNRGTQEAIRALRRTGGVLREEGSCWSREIRLSLSPPSDAVRATNPRLSPEDAIAGGDSAGHLPRGAAGESGR